jgi:hypothetical protein
VLLPDDEDQERRQQAAMRLYAEGDLAPLCDLIEQRYFKVFDNRDLRWSNGLVVKTAFLVLLFNDTYYIVDSEQSIERSYTNLTTSTLSAGPGANLRQTAQAAHPCPGVHWIGAIGVVRRDDIFTTTYPLVGGFPVNLYPFLLSIGPSFPSASHTKVIFDLR